MEDLTFTLIQTNLAWENKEANLAMLEQKISSIAEKTEVVVLPEMFSTGFIMNPAPFAEAIDGPTTKWMKNLAAHKNLVLTGSIIIKSEEGAENQRFYNRLIWMLPNGQYGCYDKRHLFAFAGENGPYTPGHKRLIASVKGWKVNLQICYDLRFPVWARQSRSVAPTGLDPEAAFEYDVLIYVADWPERRSHAWKTLLQARAIENQCYVIGVNRVGEDGNGIYHSGDSMVVGPLGDVLYQKTGEEDVFTITLKKGPLQEVRDKFPFFREADGFAIF